MNSGLSSATVLRPTRMASARARRMCANWRASGPVTQRGAPSPGAIRPSAETAIFSCTNGRSLVMRRIWPAAIQRASSAQSPRSTTTPASRSTARPRPAISGLGSSMAHTTRRMPAATMALAQGGVRPWCEQGSRLTYMVRPRARAPARSSACASACGRPPCCVQPRLIISPVVSSAMMAPTAGLGAVRPSMRCAMRSASSMRRRSRSMVEVLDERAIQHHTSASYRPPRRRAAWPRRLPVSSPALSRSAISPSTS